nr:hypothetical protein CFP56_66128 [Quercus suber]
MTVTAPSETYPLELHYVKTLFLEHQYRQCIQAGRELLHEIDDVRFPLHRPYICFFLGSAHDELARLIHQQSNAKLPAFDQAAQYYTAALDALPSARTSYNAALARVGSQAPHSIVEKAASNESNASISRRSFEVASDGGRDRPDGSLSPASLRPYIRTDSNPPSSANSSSGFSFLANPDGLKDFMAPSHLKRDMSRMSLLNSPPKPFDKALPSRPGTDVDADLREGGSGSPSGFSQTLSRLPRLAAAPTSTSDRASKIRQIVHTPVNTMFSPDESSPAVSPIGSDDEFSTSDTDDSISPVSPTTPTYPAYFNRRPSVQAPATLPTEPLLDPAQDYHTEAIDMHLIALRAQLQTHLSLLTLARSHVPTVPQPERPKLGSRISGRTLSSRPSPSPVSPAWPTPPHQTFWSVLPEPTKQSEQQRRIQEGRARGWVKQRFQPERYRRLADAALTEL